MNDEDRKYLQSVRKMRPSLEIFSGMVRILENTHKHTDQLLNNLNKSLLETFKTIL